MRILAFVVIFFLRVIPLRAQELLVNGSFEEENICTEFIKNCAPEGWISNSFISNYYFNISNYGLEGMHFVGLIAGNNRVAGKRTFIRSRLVCALRKDHQYKLQFFVRSRHNIYDSVGVYFSSRDFLFDQRPFQQLKPALLFVDTLAKDPDNSWTKMEWIYTATGEENFITIGCFKRKEYSFMLPPEINGNYYMYIDSISMKPVDPQELICSAADSMKTEIYDENERHNLMEKKVAYYKRNPPAVSQPPVTEIQRIDTLIIPDILFATASAKLNPLSAGLLDSFATALNRGPVDSLIIEGHTDSIGTLEYNNNLSKARAESVATYLGINSGVGQDQTILRYFAFTKPISSNQTETGRQKNRRVEIYVYRRERNRGR